MIYLKLNVALTSLAPVQLSRSCQFFFSKCASATSVCTQVVFCSMEENQSAATEGRRGKPRKGEVSFVPLESKICNIA